MSIKQIYRLDSRPGDQNPLQMNPDMCLEVSRFNLGVSKAEANIYFGSGR